MASYTVRARTKAHHLPEWARVVIGVTVPLYAPGHRSAGFGTTPVGAWVVWSNLAHCRFEALGGRGLGVQWGLVGCIPDTPLY